MKALINYLNSPLINVAEICRVCEINPGFMSGVLNGSRNLPEKHLWNILKALCGDHGFVLKGYTITFEDHVFIYSIPTGEEGTVEEIESNEGGSSHFAYHVPMYKGLLTDDLELVDFLKSLK